jgi:TonB-linked SusC/RagA family outer membrane protein
MLKHLFKALSITAMLCASLWGGQLASAQSRAIFGKVVDANGEPVIGAAVLVPGTTTGATTDLDGNFNLRVEPGSALEVSCIGYVTRRVNATDNMVITLQEDAEMLEETVVVGYGVQRKKLVTGSTVSVSGDKLAAVHAVDAFGALQSQAAGVTITQNSGQPGESFKVTIRGMGTVGSNTPLYVVDGVPGGSITALSPDDIESIDVLKDAASSAIYGSRAANGVILVTTKKGKAGKVQVTFDGYYGWQNANTNGVTPLNAKQYMEINDRAYDIQGVNKYDWASLIPKQYAQIQNGSWNGTNWLEETLVKNAPTSNASVNILGGSDVSRFAIGFSQFSQTGTIGYPATPQYDRTTVRLNSDYSLIRKNNRDVLKFGENITFTYTNKKGLSIGGIYDNNIREMLSMCPLMPVRDEQGDWYEYEDIVADNWDFSSEMANPLASVYYRRNNRYNKGYRLQTNFYLEFAPIKGLTFRSSVGWQYNHSESRSYVPVYQLSTKTSNPEDDVRQDQSYSMRWSWENTANWVHSFGYHNLDILAGQSLEKWGYGNSVGVGNSNSLFPGSFDHAYIVNANVVDASYTSISGRPNTQGAMSSFFGRVNYNYNETYLFTAVLRADGSSNFGRGHRWGVFPSVSAGWVVSNEPFMEFSKNWLSFFKLRGGWGQNGNCNIREFAYVANIAFGSNYYFDNKDNPGLGAYPDNVPNPNVTWETSEQLNLGFDARFFRSRLGLTFDWYNKTTKDWLLQVPRPLTAGAGDPYENAGAVRNRGVEVLLSWNDDVNRDFSYGINTTFSYNQNVVTAINNSEGIIHGGSNAIAQNTAELYRVQVGFPIGYFWGYEMDGIIQNEQQKQEYLNKYFGGDASKSFQGNSIQPGDVMFVDRNGDGKIDESDKTMIGDPNPDFTVGLSINLAYKGFDFSLSGHGAFGQQVAKSYRQFSDHPDDNYTTDVYTKYWNGEGSTNHYPRFTHGKHVNMSELSRVWLEDADFFKITDITVGYDFKRLVKNLPVSRCRLFVNASNMFTFTGYSGMDPEVGFGNGTSWASGIDNGYYPSARSWRIGVNVTF